MDGLFLRTRDKQQNRGDGGITMRQLRPVPRRNQPSETRSVADIRQNCETNLPGQLNHTNRRIG